MRIAITGGMGFIGTELISSLDGKGHQIVLVDFWEDLLRDYEKNRYPVLDRVYRNLATAAEVLHPKEFLDQLKSYSPEVIIHLGACVDTTDMGSDEMMQLNVGYVRELVAAANNGRGSEYVPGIIFASSAATYGSDFTRPNNPYGLTKVMGERLVSETRGELFRLRFFNVFGAMEHHKLHMASLPFKLAQAYKRGDRFDLHSPDSARDFISVSSVASIVSELALQMETKWSDWPKRLRTSRTFDVGTARPTSFTDLDNFIMQATGNVVSCVREVPMPGEICGRYQHFTCAGTGPNPVPVLGADRQDTRTGIEEQYGRR